MQPRAGFNSPDDTFEGETLKMPSAAQKQPVQAIAETPAVRNADEEAAFRSQDATDLADGARKVMEMFQTVVADDQVETTARERHAVTIGTGAGKARILCERLRIHVDSGDVEPGQLRG